MGVQLLAVVAAIAIAVIGTVLILTLVQAVFGTRAGVREQLAGLDLSEHGEEAYFGWDGSAAGPGISLGRHGVRSEEHTSELQSQSNLVCRLLLEKKKKHE